MKVMAFVCSMLGLMLALGGTVVAQDDSEQLPQVYENEETGLSFRLPEGWVVEDRFYTTVYVANTEESMGHLTVLPGDLFITISIFEREEWADRVDITDGVTAREMMAYYEADYLADPSVTDITLDAISLEAYELDAATYAGTTDSRDWIYITLIPNDTHLMRVQAATVPGEMPAYVDDIYAFANTIRYDGRQPEILRVLETRREPLVFTDERVDFSFEYPWWLIVEVLDEQSVRFSAAPEAEDPFPPTGLSVALPIIPYEEAFSATIEYKDYDALSDDELALLDDPLAWTLQRLTTDYPDAEIGMNFWMTNGGTGIWARAEATVEDDLQIGYWVLVPADLEQVVFMQMQSSAFFDRYRDAIIGIGRTLSDVDLQLIPFPM